MSRRRLAGLNPYVREAADWSLAWADYYDVPVDVTSGFRDWEKQRRLYDNYQGCLKRGLMGRTPECRFPANPPGDSAHNFGLAWDSVTDPRFQEWWNLVRRMAGFEVLPNDIIHAQVANWRGFV